MSFRTRVILTIAILITQITLQSIYARVQGPLESAAGISQLNGTNSEYIIGRAISQGDIVYIIGTTAFCLIFLIWIPQIIKEILKVRFRCSGG